MAPLPQPHTPSPRGRVPLRMGFHLLLILMLLTQIILFSSLEAPQSSAPPFSQTPVALNSLTPQILRGLPPKQPAPLIPPHLPTPESPFGQRPALPSGKPKVAIIIDDLGFVRKPTEDFWELDIPLTFAVLPGGQYSRLHAEQALKLKQEVILHLPMEPLDPSIDPGPGVIRSSFTPKEVLAQLRENLQAVPGIIGVNNHMGSKGTQDPALLQLIMQELKEHGLFFIDSMTIDASLAAKIARAMGVPTARRDVFLDGLGIEGIPGQVRILIEKALARGTAIGIAHTRPGVAQAIADCLPLFAEAQVELVHISALVE